MVENGTGLKVECLQLDTGGEYIDDDFKLYCDDNGIKMKKTIQGKPQQNAAAERMNKTVLSVLRA